MAGIRRAIALDEQGHPERAAASLEPLAREYPDAHAVAIYRATYWNAAGRSAEAIAEGRRAVQLAPGNSLASLSLFHALWDAGRHEEAIDEIRRFLPLRRSAQRTAEYETILVRWEAAAARRAWRYRVSCRRRAKASSASDF